MEALNGKHDLVIGAITNYTTEHIRCWVNSLERCGYEGGKILLCYNINSDTLAWIQSKGIETCVFQQDKMGNAIYEKEYWNIVVERFFHYWQLLRCVLPQHKFRYIIATDVKDVIFQTNPSVYLENVLIDNDLLLSSENLKYKDEPWGFDNLNAAFGRAIHSRYLDSEIVNCGVLAGKQDAMIDLFLNIALICQGMPSHVPGGGGPDQAALNILMGLSSYQDVTQISHLFSAQLGTTGDPRKIESFKEHYITNSLPEWDGEYFMNSYSHEKYPIVHQWDRASEEIVSKIKEKYS